ncbi:MAG: PorV/PorQ family protein [Nitrospirae bacterium]|nr:PorV/PorQ family protein [Nitrospirota bacterium]
MIIAIHKHDKTARIVTILAMIFLISILLVSILTNTAAAGSVATKSGQFLNIGAGARAMAMGGAQVAMADDAYALYWNPAGLSNIKRRETIFSYMFHVQDMKLGYLGIITPCKKGVMGTSISYLTHDNILGYDHAAKSTGCFEAGNMAIDISYGRKVDKKFSAGGNIKFISEKIDANSDIGIGLDLGGMLRMNKYVSMGAVLKNVTVKELQLDKKKEALPTALVVGVACQIPEADLNLTCDATIPSDNNAFLNAGVEYSYQHSLTARLGIKGGHVNDSAFTAGFGYSFGLFSFDYCMEPFGDMGNSHHVSMQYRF